ncbi:hypothetical protein WR25_20384 [Diploscapter pachys]|uniref:Plastocyanin-like domain-containing protein n=1 Tax=Diploscapter pachys TaxID=2018661 RepID=A0A2A2KQG2_9BILA|nr:hypothetical protein WR25_20384 [Diploscapter pachys]
MGLRIGYRFLIFAILAKFSVGYQKYAQPIKLSQPEKDGTYAFDMVITRKLTMSFHNDNVYLHGTPVDYDPKTMRWSKRDPDQTVDCFANYAMNPNTNPQDASAMEDVLTYDGLHKRVLAVNGISPGLPIVVPYNSSVLLRVRNQALMDSLSIHVHGIDKHGMWFMDGVSYVQQCPIHSTNYFEYRFIADNKGTHWYHGHMQTDRGDGLYGSFIVVDPNDRSVPVDTTGKREIPSREYVVMIAAMWEEQYRYLQFSLTIRAGGIKTIC